MTTRAAELQTGIDDLGRKRDEERGGAMKRLEEDVASRQKEDVKAQTNLTHKRDALKAEQKKLKDIKKTLTDVCVFFVCIICILSPRFYSEVLYHLLR